MGRFVLICLGGAAGTGARYLMSLWSVRAFGPGFPWGTLLVNAIGSFLISILMQVGLSRGTVSPDLRLILTTGVMGGFTTYSSFNFETLRMVQHHAAGLAALYIAATVLGCLAAGVAGLLMGRALA